MTRDWLEFPLPSPFGDITALANATNAFAVPTRLALNRVFRFFSFVPFLSPPFLGQRDKLTAAGTSASFDFSEKPAAREESLQVEVTSFEFKLNFLEVEFRIRSPWFKSRCRNSRELSTPYRQSGYIHFRYTRRDKRLFALFIVIRRGGWKEEGKRRRKLVTYRCWRIRIVSKNYSTKFRAKAWQLLLLLYHFSFLYFRFFASSTWIYAFLRFLRFEIFQPAYIRIFGIKGVAYSSAVVSSRDEQVLFYFQSRSLLPRVKLLSHS